MENPYALTIYKEVFPSLPKIETIVQNILPREGTIPELPPNNFSNIHNIVIPELIPPHTTDLSRILRGFALVFSNTGGNLAWMVAVPGTLLILSLSRRFWPKKKQPIPIHPPPMPVVKKNSPNHHLGIEIPGEGLFVLDYSNPNIRRILQEYGQRIQHLSNEAQNDNMPARIVLGENSYNLSNPHAIYLCREMIHKIQKTSALPPPEVDLPRLMPPAGIEVEKITKQLDWEAIENYVSQHCPGVPFNKVKEMASEGIQIIQKLRKNEKIEQTNLDNKLAAVCWGFMAHAITKGQPFVEGTFDINDPDNRIFHFFLPTLYGRASSHYKKRTISFEKGPWSGYGHFGLDLNMLPSGKRSVMMGRIETRDRSNRTYLKMENWGANLNVRTDPRALANFHQVVAHSLEFFESQAKHNLPGIFGEVGGGLHMRKEHMLLKDKEKITQFIQEAQKHDPSIQMSDLNEYGFQDAIPCLEDLTHNNHLRSDLQKEIEEYLDQLHARYDRLPHRKGNEIAVGDSILDYEVQSSAADEDFEIFEPDGEDGISEWKIAYDRLMSTDYLSNHTVITFGNLLEKEKDCTFVPDLLIPGMAESREDKQAFAESIISKAITKSKKGPIFIPCILDNPAKRIPFIGSYFSDHIVVVTVENGNWEYYDPQGTKLEDETRNVLGFDLSPQKLFTSFIQGNSVMSNTNSQQKDRVNCGTLVCNYMFERREKTLKEISLEDLDPIQMRLNLAAQLKRKHDPLALKEAMDPADVTARLDFEHARCYSKETYKLLQENAQHYLKEETLDKDRIFDQINKDLKRDGDGMNRFSLNGVEFDGLKEKNAQAIFQELLKTGRAEKEILTLMTLLQQGVFGSIEMAIWKDLDIVGPDSGFQIRGQGPFIAKLCKKKNQAIREYNIETKGKQILLNCSSFYEVVASDSEKSAYREDPYGILKVNVQLDLDKREANESWQVTEIIH